MPDSYPLHLAVALDGAGWHPAAWRASDARPQQVFSARYWTDLVQEAERGLLDFVAFEDGLAATTDHHVRPSHRTDLVTGRLDAELLAARVAPVTAHIGLLPTVVAPLTEPFHVSKATATLDYVSTGRAGVRVRTSASPEEFANIGRRPAPQLVDDIGGRAVPTDEVIRELFGEVADYVEVLRRLWDSWEDDAEIRDIESGRFVDRNRLHYIDFEGDHFTVRGPSITPRPPQGQPLIAVLGHQRDGLELIGRTADLGLVTPTDEGDARSAVSVIRSAAVDAERDPEGISVLADVTVFLDDTAPAAQARKDLLDDWHGTELVSDAATFVGSAEQLADQLLTWQEAGIDGFRLRPATLPHDLIQITQRLVPTLQRLGVFRPHYTSDTLRGHFGLDRPASRYAIA
ncbi:LLM class flavin-dependent oxidoreductase [Flexivirga meconopsidis]|uniref:LLM class flavin-dependent oxidoreductase n=1 Tax=Flexivirga meconopsidis TaxID=2977121 RepID=UPI00223EC044|nr:LLM class flavin-dependent oxidoreductase [Flexivirga meconopsidis]